MTWQDKSNKPEPHFTVLVQIKEVTPAYSVGTQVRHEREVEDVINVAVKAGDLDGAISKAIGHLRTAGDEEESA